jgi:hypothetical protein
MTMKRLVFVAGMILLMAGFVQAQVKSSMAVKDLDNSIGKYIKKNYEGFKAVEAFKYVVCYEVVITKGGSSEGLVFDEKGKFLTQKTETIVPVRTRTTMSLKDLDSGIEKYVKKNHEGYKITEAYKYDIAYSVKIVKGNESDNLLFDKDGQFEKKLAAPVVKETVKKADSIPAKKEKKEEPKKSDTAAKK